MESVFELNFTSAHVQIEIFQVSRSIFYNLTIFKHYAPTYLNRLEFDIFMKKLNKGVEYLDR